MRNFPSFFVAFLALVVLVPSGCRKETAAVVENETKAYSDMLAYAEQYSSIFNEQKTKSGDNPFSDLKSLEPDFDLTNIDLDNTVKKPLQYIDIYTEPEICEWNEKAVLRLVEEDISLTSEEKDIIIRGIAAAYCMKNESLEIIPADGRSLKLQQLDCLQDYNKNMRRAAELFMAGLIIAAYEPSIVVEIAALAYYCIAVRNAQQDYEICMERCDDGVQLPDWSNQESQIVQE